MLTKSIPYTPSFFLYYLMMTTDTTKVDSMTKIRETFNMLDATLADAHIKYRLTYNELFAVILQMYHKILYLYIQDIIRNLLKEGDDSNNSGNDNNKNKNECYA